MKHTLFLLICLMLATPALAASEQEKKDTSYPTTLKANLRRVGLELSSTEVKNAKYYQDSSVSALNSDSQKVVKGVLDFVLEYQTSFYRWDNGVFAEYAKTKLKSADGTTDNNETADKILFSSNYTQRVWKFDQGSLGPFVDAGYQTEFTRNDDAPRTSTLRGKLGLKLFDSPLLKDLYAAAVGEYDMTYNPDVSKLAGEVGFRIEQNLREDVKLSADGYYRRYFSFSQYEAEDLRYDLNITARMDVKMINKFYLGPYISYRRAHSRGAPVSASNFMIGLSFSYADAFDLIKSEEK